MSASPTYESFIAHARQSNIYSAIMQLQSAGTPTQGAEAFRVLQLDAYWKQKDLPACVALSHAGILFCLTHAQLAADAALQIQFRVSAKGLAYNLGSFTWPGWDEPGIALTPELVALGLQAARLNLQLALELHKPADKMRHAHWLVGAHLLAAPHAGHLEEALSHFAQALPPPPADDFFKLARGYVLLADCLLGKAEAETSWSTHIAELQQRSDEGAQSTCTQLLSAHRVFMK
jgi:hypothetical protein